MKNTPLTVGASAHDTDAAPEQHVWRDPFEDLVDMLRAEPDVVLAICRAYSLVDSGRIDRRLRRGPEELPDAFAIRGGALIEDAAALHRLTELYHEARFSTHAMAAGQREDAIALLRSLRREAGQHAVDVSPLVAQR